VTPAEDVERYKKELRTAHLRVTSGRMAVLQSRESAPHTSADKVFATISRDLTATSPQAVYMILNDLLGAGLIRKFEPAGSAALYERRAGDNHHHVVCDSCGTVQDVDCIVGEPPCMRPVIESDFQVREAEITFWGLCSNCREAAPSTDTSG
jgi:Fe2+ or Zn2+ uptake regulation protein